jgi:twitching motility protein PilT
MQMQLHDLLHFVVKQGASDLHLAAGEIPAVRIDGEIRRLDKEVLGEDDARRLAYALMNAKQRAWFENELEIDFSVGVEGLARFRVNAFTQSRGVGMVLRRVPTEISGLDALGAPAVFRDLAQMSKGLVLVAGPTGSGKSTTLAAVIDHINRTRNRHIITVEDPIEFVHTPRRCVINQREVGAHTKSFTAALRSALREDPDVILVGEMRDLETMSLALTAAETGHLVLATLHTNSCADTVSRIVDAFPPGQQNQIRTMLAASLEAVVTQALVRRAGSRGRVAAFEVMRVTNGIRNLIRENKLHQIPSAIQAGGKAGMRTMADALGDLVERGLVSEEEVQGVLGSLRVGGVSLAR